jgi:hypothetical protein
MAARITRTRARKKAVCNVGKQCGKTCISKLKNCRTGQFLTQGKDKNNTFIYIFDYVVILTKKFHIILGISNTPAVTNQNGNRVYTYPNCVIEELPS